MHTNRNEMKLIKAIASLFSIALTMGSLAPQAKAQLFVNPTENIVLDNDALVLATSGNFSNLINGRPFQQEALITHEGYQYSTWYHNGAEQDIFLSRRNLNGTTWETFDTGINMEIGNQDWNSHNVISMGISGDGRIHLSYDHHVDGLRYITTGTGVATSSGGTWNSSIFGQERNSLNLGGSSVPTVTYPRFTNVGDDLVFTYRERGSGNGDVVIADYDSQTGTWGNKSFVNEGQIGSGTYDDANNNPSNRRNAYHNGFHADSTGRLHTTWTWREGTQDGNHDINYAYSDDKGVTWFNNDGILTGTNASPINVNSNVEVVDLDRRQALINHQGQIVDGDGGVHVLMYHRRQEPGFEWQPGDGNFFSGDSAYHHYYRDPQTGSWDVSRLPVDTPVGDRPRLSVDSNGHLFGLYVQNDDLVIAGAQRNATGYDDWEILYRDDRHNYAGTPFIDNTRLFNEGILSVYLQEEATSTFVNDPTGSPLRILEFETGALAPAVPGDLIAGWDLWANNGVRVANVTDGNTNATTANKVGFGINLAGNTDGTWGSLDTPSADITANANSDSAWLPNGADGSYDFVVTDTGGVDRELATFHFDSATFRPNSARNYVLSIVSGDLTQGTIATGVIESLAGGQQDWADIDIDLTSLDDSILDANGTVTFRLEFTGGTLGAAGHHQYLDNVAITANAVAGIPGDYNGDGLVDAADFVVWRDGNSPDSTLAGYQLWVDNYGTGQPSTATSATVPEPTALLLAAMGLSTLLTNRTRSKI